MNWVLIIAIVLLIWRIADGYKKGMVKEILSFISLLVLCVAVVLIGNALNSYFDKEVIKTAVAVILLLVLIIVHRLLGLVIFPAKLIVKLPLVRSLDKLLGVIIGILETILIIWTVYALIMTFGLGMIGQQILIYVEESKVLLALFEYNYLAKILEPVTNLLVK